VLAKVLKAKVRGKKSGCAIRRLASVRRVGDRLGAGARVSGRTLLLVGISGLLAAGSLSADVFKYVDKQGNVFFSDEPLTKSGLRLEWKRSATRLAARNKAQAAMLGQQQAAETAVANAQTAALEEGRPSLSESGSLWARRLRYQHLIEAAARRHGLMPELLHAVIRTESAYKADALSHAGASGLMQLMPGTAKRFGVERIWDPAQNIEGGAAYLRFLLNLFDHDLRLALAGYNAGEGAVKRYGNQIPPYPETQGYVRKVLQFLWAEEAFGRS
jgi:soluble lytic murein transglycosylase-like protein